MVNIIEAKASIVAIILFLSNILFNCLQGPTKKNDDASEFRFPNVKRMANLYGLNTALNINKNEERIDIANPITKQEINPIILYFTGHEGHAESFVKTFCTVSEPNKLSLIYINL